MIACAYMDTEHFQFHAFGATELHAREQLAAGFERHLKNNTPKGDDPFAFWDGEAPDHERLNDYYGIRVVSSEHGHAFCDGEPI